MLSEVIDGKRATRHKCMRALGVVPVCDPSPMTREGTHALVERFYAMRRAGVLGMVPEVGGGGAPGGVGTTTPIPSGPTKSKRALDKPTAAKKTKRVYE